MIRTLQFTLVFFLGLNSTHANAIEDSHAANTVVKVSFNQPEAFTDFQAANGGRNHGRTVLMAEIDRFLRERGELWLPQGQHLEVVFQDIDMAGRLVPLPLRANVGGEHIGVFGSAPEQRVVSSPWPPRLSFDFEVHNEYGEVVRQGSADISEASFLKLAPRSRLNRRDSLWYEKAVLDSWMREFAQR